MWGCLLSWLLFLSQCCLYRFWNSFYSHWFTGVIYKYTAIFWCAQTYWLPRKSQACALISLGYEEGLGLNVLAHLMCTEKEASLDQFDHERFYEHEYSHFEDLGIICITHKNCSYRLVCCVPSFRGFTREIILKGKRIIELNSNTYSDISSASLWRWMYTCDVILFSQLYKTLSLLDLLNEIF